MASTFVGGSNGENGPVILKLDSSGNVFIAGKTASDNYPITPGAYNTSSKDGFISMLDNNLTNLLASTFLGGSFNDYFTSLTFDSSGNVFVGGCTDSSDFPTTPGAYDTSYGGGDTFPGGDIFISKLNSTLSSLLASTFVGEEENEQINGLVIDSSGNVYITGSTDSFNYPVTPGAYDTSYNGSYDVFVSKLDNNLKTLLASTFIGGSQEDRSNAIILDSFGNVLITGQTLAYPGISSYYPTTPGAYDTSISGYIDVFVSKLDSNLTNLISSTFIGGGAGGTSESASTISLDSSGNVFIAGFTENEDFPTTSGAYDNSYNGGTSDIFISKFNDSLTNLLASTFIGGSDNDSCLSLVLDFSGNVFITGMTVSTDFPTTPGTYDMSLNGEWDTFVAKLDSNLSEGEILCGYSISPISKTFSANGGSGTVNVYTNSNDCSWTATSNASWITITSTSGGTGNGWVVYWVIANTGVSSRTGTMTIAGPSVSM